MKYTRSETTVITPTGFQMDEQPKTISVPEAGRRYFNLKRNGSYEAAHRGEIPVPFASAVDSGCRSSRSSACLKRHGPYFAVRMLPSHSEE